MRPHTRLMFDLTFLTPVGVHGEVGAFTCICLYTKLVWLRAVWDKTPRSCAYALFSVVCDSGVCPLGIYSDRDSGFREAVVLEFTGLMNVKQGFSMAYSPESHGLIERTHLELQKNLGKAAETTAGSQGSEWPYFLPLAEMIWRLRVLPSGASPMELSRGYYGSTTLMSALGALAEIPPGLPHTTWMRGLLACQKEVSREHDEAMASERAAQAAISSARKGIRPREFREGEHVLLHRGPDLTTGHKLRGKATGPYEIVKVKGDAVHLRDALSGKLLLDSLNGLPDNINVDRLMKVTLPVVPTQDMEDIVQKLDDLQVGDLVAYLGRGGDTILVLEVEEIEEDVKVEGKVLEVPEVERTGGWARRPWANTNEERATVLWENLVAPVSMHSDKCLSVPSLEQLRRLGAQVY